MAYADDLAFIARPPFEVKRLLAVVETEVSAVGLRFNPAKCATLHVGASMVGRILPTIFAIQDQPVRSLTEGEAHEYFGISTEFSLNQTSNVAMQTLSADFRAVDRPLLTPLQISEVVPTFLLSRPEFLLRVTNVENNPLKAIDLQICRQCKAWIQLSRITGLPPSR